MPLHNDEPTLIDQLNRVALVDEVGEAIATCEPPQVFGIHGDWGLGKTSFLHQLQWYLTGECPQQTQDELTEAETTKVIPKGQHQDHVTVVWFEAWRYQHEQVPVVALLQEIRSQLAWYVTLGQQAKKMLEVTIRSALLSLEDLTKKIGIHASKIQEVGDKWERDHLATALPSYTIREHLQEAIGKLLHRSKNARLVVLIDDLDRCEAESAYKLLEGLKIYLTLRNCVFVLGLNQKIIEDAIRKNMPGDSKQDLRAAAYLEKLCQNFWRLPLLADPKVLLYQWLPDDIIKEWITVAIGESQCLPPNPRRLKGLANLLQRFITRLPKTFGDKDDPAMIQQAKLMLIVAYVYQFHHDLFLRWESNPELYHHIRDWVRTYKAELKFLEHLELPYKIETDESTPTPQYKISSAYPDPTESNIFWIQPLIHKLGDEVKPEDFLRYLRGKP